jgi:SAM-dependent methyltransferase
LYEHIARYYDLIHAELTADIGLVLAMAGQVGGGVLELGCGTGRLLIPLARAGHRVVGLDNSPAMLARARTKVAAEAEVVRERVQLVEGDMKDFELGEQFGLVIFPYNTLLHLEPAMMEKAFRCAGRHLAAAGRVLVDIVNPLLAAQTPEDRMLTLERVMVDPETGETVVQMASSWVDQEKQVLHITWLYDASPAEGGPVRRTVVEAKYHYLYPHELELLLDAAGLRLAGLFGGYEDEVFEEGSERFVVVAKRGD